MLYVNLLLSCLVIFSCQSKRFYPSNSVIGLYFKHPENPATKAYEKFGANMEHWLKVFSDEKGDFRHFADFDLKKDKDKITHLFHIEIDSLHLVDYSEHLKKHKEVNKELDAWTRSDPTFSRRMVKPVVVASVVLSPLTGSIIIPFDRESAKDGRVKRLVGKASACPKFYVKTIIWDMTTNRPIWSLAGYIENNTYEPMRDHEQIKHLLSILDSEIRGRVPLFQLEK